MGANHSKAQCLRDENQVQRKRFKVRDELCMSFFKNFYSCINHTHNLKHEYDNNKKRLIVDQQTYKQNKKALHKISTCVLKEKRK